MNRVVEALGKHRCEMTLLDELIISGIWLALTLAVFLVLFLIKMHVERGER